MKKVKLGILGVGPRGQCLLETYALTPTVEVTAICDRADGLAAQVAKKYEADSGVRGVKIYTDYDVMMREKNFDALIITLDPDHQIPVACDAMERGVHVMTEVPCCTSIEDCWKLVNTVEKTGMKYQLSEQVRYWYFISEWRKMAQQNQFGKLLMVEGQYLHYEPTWDFFVDKRTGEHIQVCDNKLDADENYVRSWRYRLMSHPIFYLPHTLSPLLSITGGRIEKVACFGTRKESYFMDGIQCRDVESAIMYNSNDVIFNVRAGFTSPHSRQAETGAHWYHVKGTQGSVEWSRAEDDKAKLWMSGKGWEDRPDWTCADANAEEWIKNSPHGGTDGYPIKYFADAILNDTEPPMNVYRAVETAAPAIMAAKSSELGGVLLDVPDFRKKKCPTF